MKATNSPLDDIARKQLKCYGEIQRIAETSYDKVSYRKKEDTNYSMGGNGGIMG